jgi:hypothetical protein
MVACQSCGTAIEALARICPSCGALTGVRRLRDDAPIVASEPVGIGMREAIIWIVVVVTFLVITGWISG